MILSIDGQKDRPTDRWTDGQGETSIPPFNFAEQGGIIIFLYQYFISVFVEN